MNKERWEMIQAKFHELAELDAAQRDTALSRLDVENPALADEVRDLLNAGNTGCSGRTHWIPCPTLR
jgi:hypothetical protein